MAEQTELYGIVLDIRPTGGLTFRRVPSAILHISTYPFLPPSTMSGWLRRLFMLQRGIYPDTDVQNPDYFVMPQSYHILGAYPVPDPRKSGQIHTTRRHGIRAFNHNAFSRIAGSRGSKEVYQLHTWEYLMAERLRGFVLHSEPTVLETIQTLENLGCKCGKEGYAYLERISEVRRFALTETDAFPATPAVGEELLGKPADLFVAYRHQYSPKQPANFALESNSPSNIEGFVSIWLGWPAARVTLTCWSDGDHCIPAGMLEVF